MKKILFFAALCGMLCSCNTLYVSSGKNASNTPAIGVDWSYGDIPDYEFQKRIDSTLRVEIDRFNTQKHSFSVHQRNRKEKEKDYITVDFEKAKVVGSGAKTAGYIVTTLGLAAPIILAATKSPLIISFYYWPNHTIQSTVTLSPNLSGERKNNKKLTVMTGALFASTEGQVNKLLIKYADNFHKVLADVEMQLDQHK